MASINRTINIQDLNRFNEDCKAHNAKILIVLKFGVDNLRFDLSEPFTVQEHTDLDAYIATFVDSNPEDKIPRIYSIVKGEAGAKHFHNIDYKKELSQALIPKRSVSQGEVTQVDWYEALNSSMVPEGHVLKVVIVYQRDSSGFALSRSTVRTWINEDGTENDESKITNKYYFVNPSDMIDEGLKRRKLLVSSIQIPTLTFMTEALMLLGYSQEAVMLKGRNFMDDYETFFNKFIDNSSTITDPADPDVGEKTIVVRLRDEARFEYTEWLDKAPASLGGMTTIRQYLISEFDI